MPLLSVPFTNTQQEKKFWCWAAVAANVYNSMRPPAQPAKTQCDVATSVEKRQADCQSQDGHLDALSSALSALGIADPDQVATRPPFDPSMIVDEFEGVSDRFDPGTNENRISEPVCAEIVFPGPAVHFVAISAIDTGTQHVWVADPLVGGNPVEFTFADFTTNYHYASPQLPSHGVVRNFLDVVNKWQVEE